HETVSPVGRAVGGALDPIRDQDRAALEGPKPIDELHGHGIIPRHIDRLGPFEGGTILIADRIEGAAHSTADGRDCLVSTMHDQLLFRRIVANTGSGVTAFVPYDNAQRVDRHVTFKWVAPVVLAVRYFV
ncbi:MAG: hypothetical protein RL291_1071, partial [Pseudomonadota bacterium]